MKTLLIILFSWLVSVKCADPIKIIYVDDSQVMRKATQRAVERYNREERRICLSLYEDGDQLFLETLEGVHLVWCDINMARVNGNLALSELIKKATDANFRLPPFFAVTNEAEYHNTSIESSISSSALARNQSFLGGCNKISKEEDISRVLEFCEKNLGENWLRDYVGAYLPADNHSDSCIDEQPDCAYRNWFTEEGNDAYCQFIDEMKVVENDHFVLYTQTPRSRKNTPQLTPESKTIFDQVERSETVVSGPSGFFRGGNFAKVSPVDVVPSLPQQEERQTCWRALTTQLFLLGVRILRLV